MSEYIMELRKLVGHRPLIQVGASVIVEDEKGRILLQKRTDCGSWGYCGGAVELYESVEDAARRELYEETGLRAERLEPFTILSGEKMTHTYPNGDQVSMIAIVYLCRNYSGELNRQEEEVQELAFFPYDGLPEDIFPPEQEAIRLWTERKAKGKTL